MVKIIQLHTMDGTLEIDATYRSWCQCWLLLGSQRISLGAESFSYIASHLLSALEMTDEQYTSEWHGYQVKWALSLADNHSTLYVAGEGSQLILLWQAATTELIARFRLSTDDCSLWRTEIQSS